MKAIIFSQYGLPDVLELKEIEKPVPKDNEVLIKVHAASINDWDWQILRGVPFVNRIMAGLLKPKKIKILGSDIAGQIEAVGKKVKQLKVGDEVFGDLSDCGFGGFAEYVCAKENALILKPNSMTFEQAAAIPQAACLALAGLQQGKIKSGQQVLINGAAGGTGSFAVQLAKSFATEVTAVCRTSQFEFVRSIGADHVIDFTQQDYTKTGQRYDLILDLISYHSVFSCRATLEEKGTYVVVGGSGSSIQQVILFGTIMSIFSTKKMGLLLLKQNKVLPALIELFEQGKFVPIIDKSYTLNETAAAMRYFAEGHKKGKVVITLDQN